MAQLEGLKEESVYLRLWLGILVVAELSLVGWLASALATASPGLLFVAVIGIILLGVSIYLLHRQIERRIEQIRSL